MALCTLDGSSDMYGLGIRLGFYLQWYSAIFASWLAPSEIEGLRFTNSLFVASTFLALIVSTASDVSNLQPVDIYITLLLTFGYYLFLVPLYAWRIVTAGNASLDPTRWPIVRPGQLFNVLTSLLLLAVGAFQLWFWAGRVTQVNSMRDCPQYGFFFARIHLNSLGFRILNLVLYSLVLLACVSLLLIFAAKEMGFLRRSPDPPISDKQKKTLQQLQPLSNLVIASVVVLATELTIKWNGLRSVNSLSSAGQTIPFVIGIGSLVRVFYIYIKPMLKARWGSGTQVESSQEAKDPPGPVPFEVTPVPYSATVEWIDVDPQNTTDYVVDVEPRSAPTQHD